MLRAEDLDVQLDVSESTASAALRANAESLADRWSTLDVPAQREVFLQANVQVLVKDRRVEISVEPGQLAVLLLKSSSPIAQKAEAVRARRVGRSMDAALIKTAGETRILEEEKYVVATALQNAFLLTSPVRTPSLQPHRT